MNSSRRIANAARIASNEHETTTVNVYCKTTKNSFYRVIKTTATTTNERVAKAVSTATSTNERVAKTVSTASASKERVAKTVSTATSSKKRVAPTVRNVLLSTTHTLTASAIPTARSASQTHSQIRTSRQHVLSRQRPLPHTWCARSTRGHTRHAKATIHFRSRSYYYVMYDQLLWETTGRDVTVERLIV